MDGRTAGVPVVFIHGNVSSAVFWRQSMLDLPAVAALLGALE